MTVIIISQCLHISKYHLVYLTDIQCLFVNYTSIKPGKIFAFQLHNSHWWCLQDLSLGKDVDLFLYPVSSLVPKLVLVIQFSLPVIETTHPLEMGLGHIFCHFSPQNAYFQNRCLSMKEIRNTNMQNWKANILETCLEIQYFSTDNEHGGILFSI